MKLIEDKETHEIYIIKKCITSYDLCLYVIIFISSWDILNKQLMEAGQNSRNL